MSKSSVIEINSSMLEKNISFLRDHFGDDVIFSSVVKGNAYGHGIGIVVPIIKSCGIDHFSVFNSDEARQVHNAVDNHTRIMIMGYIADEDYEWILENEIEFFLWDLYRARKAMDAAKSTGKQAIIHIEVETGMNRTGITFDELKKLVSLIKENPGIFGLKGL